MNKTVLLGAALVATYKSDPAMIVPAGARHNVINTGDEPLLLYALYGPPEHKDGIVRAKAEATEEHFEGKTTEA